MQGSYLIPANSKKSMLIFGLFTKFDLILFGIGAGISILMMVIIPMNTIVNILLALAPGLITGFLVFPVPYYHNVMTFLKAGYHFITDRQKFVWKGWCFNGKE